MKLTEMQQAVSEAEAELYRADLVATSLAKLLVGRLRKVGGYGDHLAKLKRELRDYNINTGKWKDDT